ncbi:MAG TPA: metallophosphoesterase [Pyrinomonadaceae bacterium]|nr:metallophosphoesterase [Pyrinomonadaceae bacterium]
MKIAWATDIHLDRLSANDYLEYKDYLQELNPDCLIISGDIAEGEKVCQSLADFDKDFVFPIYFVLGNHDFYFSSFAEREKQIENLVATSNKLKWLTNSDIISLNDSTALIGTEGWGDGRNGTLNISKGYTKDLLMIEDYKGLDRSEIKKLLNERGSYYAEKLRKNFDQAVKNYENVFLVTHVPPFVEVCIDRSLRIYDEFRQPFYTCKVIGDMLLEKMNENPKCRLTVLCGHTHEKADAQILKNLRVRVKESGYGSWWDATLIEIAS